MLDQLERHHDFPDDLLIAKLIVHLAPRRLKISDCVGGPILGASRSILAGCKKSTSMARLYTLDEVATLQGDEGAADTFQHVDYLSTAVAGKTEKQKKQTPTTTKIATKKTQQNMNTKAKNAETTRKKQKTNSTETKKKQKKTKTKMKKKKNK